MMDKADYITEAVRQLSNPAFYTPLTSDPTPAYRRELKSLLSALPSDIQRQINSTTPTDPRPGIFYLLPKIHKVGNPGRPIVSGIGTITEGVSGFVDNVLRPYATSAPSYVQDTTDFLRKLQTLTDLPDDTILATMDVTSLYTNIPHADGIRAIESIMPEGDMGTTTSLLAKFVLRHNYFKFGDNLYLQTNGTAMGTRMAPQYANIFMADLEQRFLQSQPLAPSFYVRYIDDIFMIWTHGETTLEQFHRDFNMFHPSIKLTIEHSKHQVNFLDTTVMIKNGRLATTVYKKPTDRNSYLHASSFHPPHTTRSIVYSQALRYNRICSDIDDRNVNLNNLHGSFTALQYDSKTVTEQIAKAKRWDRNDLLQYKPHDRVDRTPLVVTYSPQLKPLQRIINELNPILQNDDTLKQIFKEKPLIAFRQPPTSEPTSSVGH